MKYLINTILFIFMNTLNTAFLFVNIFKVTLNFLWDFKKPNLDGILNFGNGYKYESLHEFYKHNQFKIK